MVFSAGNTGATANETPSAASGGVYHKEERSPRTRRAAVHRIDSGLNAPPRRKANREHPARTALLQSIRKFVLFALAMAALLYLSTKVLYFIWGLRDREMITPWRPPPVAAAKKGGEDITDMPAETPGTKPRPELDTEAIRKAVFLAKRGQALAAQGQYDEAIERYRDALNVWPQLTEVWADLGKLYLQVRNYAGAQISLSKAAEHDPGSTSILNDLGVAYLYLGRVGDANRVFDAAVEIDPNFAPSYFNIALCHLSRRERQEARASLHQYLKLRPNDPRALRESAFLDAEAGQYDDALNNIERAIAEEPGWPLLYFDAAAVTALMGKGDKAISYLEKAEPLSSPATVYRLYQEPAFREIRLTEIGKLFEKEIAERARSLMADATPIPALHAASEPISSSAAAQP